MNHYINGGTLVQRVTWLNTQTGAMVATDISGTGTSRVVDGGLCWIVESTLTNNSSVGNTGMSVQVFAARGSVIGTQANATTGSCVIEQVQIELNMKFYTPAIFTTTGALGRSADNLSLPWATLPGAMTVYSKFVNQGLTPSNATARLFEISSSDVDPRFLVYNPSASSLLGLVSNSGTSTNTGTVSATLGATDEVRATLTGAGVMQVGLSENGGAEVVGGASAGVALAATWGATPRLTIANVVGVAVAGIDLISFVAAAAVQSQAYMRAL